MEKHLSGFHEDPSSVSSSSISGNGSLLFNVFIVPNFEYVVVFTYLSFHVVVNYDLSMMKGKLNSESEISPLSERLFFNENISFGKETGHEGFLHSTTPLLFNVFHYDVSMMKEKEGLMKEKYKPRRNKENVDPQQQISRHKNTPQTGKCFSPHTPFSNVSTESRKRNYFLKLCTFIFGFLSFYFLLTFEIMGLSRFFLTFTKRELGIEPPQKRIDRKIPDPPVSTLTSIFDSNIKDCSWGQNRSLLNTAQTLDFDNVRECAQSDRTIDEMDYSRIVGFHVQEPDFYSDEEDVEDFNSASYDNDRHSGKCIVPIEYASLGAPNVQCDKCEACMWKEERTNKNVRRGRPQFSLCCAKGEIQLPKEKPIPSYMWQLYNDSKKGPRFKEGIRLYNSLFAFTSTGGRVDHSINCGGAPYIYRLNGQNHHLFGSLIPDDGADPKFCQLYIYDTENEVRNRMKWINVRDGQTVHAEIVEGLMKMLDEKNELVKEFRTQRDRFKDGEVTDLEITLKVSRAEDGRENHVGPLDEIAGIMVGDLDDNCGFCDIVIHSYEDGLQRISDIHPKLMSLQYPLLFPHGDDGFHVHLSYGSAGKKSSRKRALISQKEYYSYKFQVRCNQGMTPRLGDDIKKKAFFGKCLGVMYVVEFHKRGLPHVHMLIWHFPKKYSPSTTFDESGFPLYKRRNNAEAAHRIFGFNIHYRTTSVQRLSFHLPGNKTCTFRSNEPLEKVVSREKYKQSQLEAFFSLNAADSTARQYTYDEIPQYYVWNDVDRVWNVRKRGNQIGRLFYTHHSTGELWYLRLLLTKVRGPTSYKSLRIVNGVVYKTFQEACREYGLLDDDNEWNQVPEQCGNCGFAPQIRHLFVHIMVNCRVTNLRKLWNTHCTHMIDDILMMRREISGNERLLLNDKQLEFYALAEIHKLLRSIAVDAAKPTYGRL
ncbi:hypothetical protein POM88_047566 [Heracleum sosnowskyi]|uniref:Helitron helicase-like domain-containing protein n=1 Tax=Heracleum sosnowskyi TaxID=360622 RepID=A0AAD8GUF1_9APIA|nr:hypothetical protein POM88_047566 [Heracleum sosnowskyi]